MSIAKRGFSNQARNLWGSLIWHGLMLLFAAYSSTAIAQAAEVSAENARIRLLPGDLPLAGYVKIVNHSSAPIRLVGASSPAFDMIHVHRSVEEGGHSRMVSVDGVSIPADGAAELQPGGYHLMLMSRARALKVGDEVPITLIFDDDTRVTVPFAVRPAGTH